MMRRGMNIHTFKAYEYVMFQLFTFCDESLNYLGITKQRLPQIRNI